MENVPKHYESVEKELLNPAKYRWRVRLQLRHANNIELNDDITTTQNYEDIIKIAIGTYYLV